MRAAARATRSRPAALGAALAVALLGCADPGLQIVALRGAGAPCAELACAAPGTWLGVGGSDYGPRDRRITWSSASGGGASANGRNCGGGLSLAIDAEDQPMLAYACEPSTSTEPWDEVYVTRFDGRGWAEVGAGSRSGGGISNNGSISNMPFLAIAPDGVPWVAWSDWYTDIWVRRLQGEVWVEVSPGSAQEGGISRTPSWSNGPQLAFDAEGRPTVAWSDRLEDGTPIPWNYEIYIRRLRAGVWEEVGAGSASGGGVSQNTSSSGGVRLALDAGGEPTLLWGDSFQEASVLYLKRWRGGAWQEVGAGSASGYGVVAPGGWLNGADLGLDAVGEPVVAYAQGDDSTPHEIYAMRWDGQAWAPLGAGALQAGGVSRTPTTSVGPRLVGVDQERPLLAWIEYAGEVGLFGQGLKRIYVRRLEGETWQELEPGSASGAGVADSSGVWAGLSLALDRAGEPSIAWVDTTPGHAEIYLLRHVAGAWRELGRASGRGGALSDSPGQSTAPSLVLDAAGAPVVAWSDSSPGTPQIFAARLRDGAWVEVGAGSASGSGVSANARNNYGPELRLASDGSMLLAWVSEQDLRLDIYLRRFDGQAWIELGPGSASGGGVSDSSARSDVPRPGFDRSLQPVLAWNQYDSDSGTNRIYAKRFDGQAWVELGAGSATGAGVVDAPGSLSLQDLNGDGAVDPVLAWAQPGDAGQMTYLLRFDGAGWVEQSPGSASGLGIAGEQAIVAKLALGADGQLFLAWHTGLGVKVARQVGDAWEVLGGAQEGFLEVASDAFGPQLAVDGGGRPVLAWSAAVPGSREIYVLRFDGRAWVEVGAGSATGGGISNSQAASNTPSLAVRGDTACAAWSEAGARASQIVLRCARLPAP